MNSVQLTGRLTADPELKTTNSGIEVISFQIAVDRGFKDKDGNKATDFLPITAWRGTAAFIAKYFKKGDGIGVVGRIESRKYQDSDGKNRTSYDIIAENVEFPLSKRSESTEQMSCSANINADASDDDLPF